MRRRRNAKIIATLGPGTASDHMISALYQAGADAFRLNFSHGTHEDHRKVYDIIRAQEEKFQRPIAIMADLQGPKLRVGDFKGGKAKLESGAPFRLELNAEVGDDVCAHLPHPEIFKALKPDMDLLLDDGRIRLRVEQCGKDYADTTVVTGGVLSNHKGVNVPSAVLDLSPITDKDKEDLDFALSLGVDWVALSFVQRPEDLEVAHKLIQGRAGLLAKLEKPSAIEHLENIVALADAVMVARGDLGVELPPEDVPPIQKEIISECRRKGKPVVVATQMLESMISSPTPTRAEASDVATAIYDGADTVMLSAETAVGDYPIDAVDMMSRIITRVEDDKIYRRAMDTAQHEPEATSADAIVAAARQVAETVSAVTIVTFSSTGSTSLRAARERPSVPILGLTPNVNTARRLALAWGIHSVRTKDVEAFREMVGKAARIAVREEFAVSGDNIIVVAGIPFGVPGGTNVLRIASIK